MSPKIHPNFYVPGILGAGLVALKLGGLLNWSWWLVTLPFWAPLAICTSIALLALFIIGTCILLTNVRKFLLT